MKRLKILSQGFQLAELTIVLAILARHGPRSPCPTCCAARATSACVWRPRSW